MLNQKLSEEDFGRLIGPAIEGSRTALDELGSKSVPYAKSIGSAVYRATSFALLQQGGAIAEEDCQAMAQLGLARLLSKPIPKAINSHGRWLQAVKWAAKVELRRICHSVPVTSGDSEDDEHESLWSVLPDRETHQATIMRMDVEAIARLIDIPKGRSIFLALAAGKRASEIAKDLGISRQRVSVILAESVTQIRLRLGRETANKLRFDSVLK